MKHDKLVLAMVSGLLTISVLADNARFKMCIVDERTHQPLPGMKIKGVFIERNSNWNNPIVDNDFVGETSRDGVLAAKGKTNCGEAVFYLHDNSGFYDSPRIRVPFDVRNGRPIALFQWWKPDNQIITVALQRVEHPMPLFVKYVELRDFKKGIGGFDGTNSVLRFDLMKGEWLPPYGNGEVSDIEIVSSIKITGTGKYRKAYPEFGWASMNFYELVSRVSVSDVDRITTFVGEPNAGLKIRIAPDDLLGCSVTRLRGVRQVFEKNGKDWYTENFNDRDPNRCNTFRIRSRRDDKGKLIEAYYGKIYGDFEFEGDDKKGLIGVKFLYYLNPTSLDRNLEWDMKNNLCPNGNVGLRQP